MADYLTMESEEVKALFAQLTKTADALQTASDNHWPSILSEYYLTGYEVCASLHISVRTLQTLRDTRQIPFTTVGERTILYPEAGIREMLKMNYRPTQE